MTLLHTNSLKIKKKMVMQADLKRTMKFNKRSVHMQKSCLDRRYSDYSRLNENTIFRVFWSGRSSDTVGSTAK